MLPIPANYYDDLGAKYGLDEATLEGWSELGVMMERSGEGEILHAYTTPFDNRFYFELIERRHGYDGYGTGNAPFHLAALAHWANLQGDRNPH
jgi:4-hydroxyphenylpyruvate dioxygenase